jgi:hypothetical protein
MSQDKPVLSLHGAIEQLSREEIEHVRSVYKRYFSDSARIDAVCDLALIGRERQGSGKWVPLEPDYVMTCAGDEAIVKAIQPDTILDGITPAQKCYRAMLASAPQAQDAQTGEQDVDCRRTSESRREADPLTMATERTGDLSQQSVVQPVPPDGNERLGPAGGS